MAATRVLFLAYHFPPIGGGGVQRNSKFVRYLREFGYEPIVVTGPGGASGRWTPDDPTLGGDVPHGLEVHRVPGPEPAGAGAWRGRRERWLGVRTRWEQWWIDGAVETGAAAGGDAALVYASLEPYHSTAVAAATLARRLARPWVADLQDPWALDEMRIYPSRLHLRQELRRMRRSLARADAIVMNTPEAARRAVARLGSAVTCPVFSITNGYDAADFAPPVEPRADGVFRIVHTGYLHTHVGTRQHATAKLRRAVGGAVEPRVDILTRSHVYLVEALRALLAEQPELGGRVELHLAGILSDADLDVVRDCPFVRTPGYLSHRESTELVRTADLLFLPMQDLPRGVRAGLIPGKTFEYLASGRPILAAVPDGDARDLLERAGTARLCRPRDVGAMTAILREEIARRERGEPAPELRPEAIEPYERRALTRELAKVFDAHAGAQQPAGRTPEPVVVPA